MIKIPLTSGLGLFLLLGFLVNPVWAKEGKWKCDASDISTYSFNGGNSAYIHLMSYSSGNYYRVKFNETKTEAKGKTGDGTPFICTLQNAPMTTK